MQMFWLGAMSIKIHLNSSFLLVYIAHVSCQWTQWTPMCDCYRLYVFPCWNQSAENCVCILHNLTFQLEAEAPELFIRINALGKNIYRSNSQDNISPIGCFSTRSKSLEREVRKTNAHIRMDKVLSSTFELSEVV